MLQESKEEHDLIVSKTLDKVTKMEVDRSLVHGDKFNTWYEAFGFLLKELTETEEALTITKHEAETLQNAIFASYRNEELVKQANLVAFNAGCLIHEALHVRAVALKAAIQLEKAPTDCNQ